MLKPVISLGLLTLTHAVAPIGTRHIAIETSIAAYGDDHPSCTAWTDGCTICQRRLNLPPACSVTGIACQPKAPRCDAQDQPQPR